VAGLLCSSGTGTCCSRSVSRSCFVPRTRFSHAWNKKCFWFLLWTLRCFCIFKWNENKALFCFAIVTNNYYEMPSIFQIHYEKTVASFSVNSKEIETSFCMSRKTWIFSSRNYFIFIWLWFIHIHNFQYEAKEKYTEHKMWIEKYINFNL